MRKLVCFFLFFLSVSAYAKDGALIKVLPANSSHLGDYFVRGQTVEISGTVTGDLYVLGGQVFIDGTINGNVLVAGGTVNIEGRVDQNVRSLAGQVVISGSVGRSVTVLSGSLEVQPSAVISKNLIAMSGNVDLAGSVHGNALLGTSSLRLAGGVGGGVTAYVNQMRVTSKANVEGGLEYWSSSDALIDSTAHIIGGVVHHPSFFYSISKGKIIQSLRFGSTILPILMNFLYTLGLGLILMRYFPHSIKRAVGALLQNPVHTALVGIVVLVLLPLLSLLFLMSVLGVPFAITLIAVNVFAFYTAKIFTVLWLEKLIFRKHFEKHRRLFFTIGLMVYFTLATIPTVGTIISFAIMLMGLGAMVRGRLIMKETS
ncbi:MAG: polymer-forming cytoskeletal protein [Chlamydiales bacterium]|nr:polymer-forming cytoskeletal protein [Chlamydiales bacterium]